MSGLYYCTKCNTEHFVDGLVGAKHIQYKRKIGRPKSIIQSLEKIK